jgi:hypothetical protein
MRHFAYGVILLAAVAAARLAIMSSRTWNQFSFHGLGTVSASNSNSTTTTVVNETLDQPGWTAVNGTLPESALSVENNITSGLPWNNTYPHIPSKGLIIVSIMGRLGNNLFQLGFARILAKRLGGWEIAVLHNHDSVFGLDSKATQCFPHALPNTPNIEPDLTAYLNLNIYTRRDLMGRFYPMVIQYQRFHARVWEWVASQRNTSTWVCHEHTCNYTAPALSETVHDLLRPDSPTRLLHLNTYFRHYDWIMNYEQDLKEMFAINQPCCQTKVPTEAIILHFRNSELRSIRHNLTPDMVLSILKHYNYTDRPLWIVCEPESKDIVQSLADSFNATVQFGVDALDAMCMLLQATDLILSEGSSFSEIGALLGNANRVHCPVHTLDFPDSLVNPNWHYHWVDERKRKVIELDVKSSRIQPVVL